MENVRKEESVSRRIKDTVLAFYFVLRLPAIWCAKLLWGPGMKADAFGAAKILVIRLDRLGDLVLSLPLIGSLRAAYPSAKIDIMVKPYLAELAGMIQGVDNVIVYRGLADAKRALPGRGYDIAIDMLRDYKIEPAIAALFSKAPVRIGFKGGYREMLFTHPIGDPEGSDKSMIEYDLELLKPLHIPAAVKVPKIDAGKKTRPGDLVIAIHPGGHYDSQKWGAEKFAALVRKIAEAYDARIIVIGGPGDTADVRTVISGAASKGIIEEVFPSLKELVGLLPGCSLLICNNSGPLHLAAALGVPTVSMMGPTDPVLWWPKGEDQVVIRKGVKCSPCSRGRCGEHLCMDLITVDEVFGEVRKLLERVYGLKG